MPQLAEEMDLAQTQKRLRIHSKNFETMDAIAESMVHKIKENSNLLGLQRRYEITELEICRARILARLNILKRRTCTNKLNHAISEVKTA